MFRRLCCRALRALWVLSAASLAGCVFWPPTSSPPGEALSRPTIDPSAPRLMPLETRQLTIEADATLAGKLQVLFAHSENTLPDIARVYDVGYEELKSANPRVDVWLPGEDTPVYLPTQHVLPDAPHEGIVINVAAMRLYYYVPDRSHPGRLELTTHPIGIGREGWATPTGAGVVTQKARDPVWYPPASVRKEHAELGDPLPRIVPAGPDNPLGRFALALSLPGYLIHGTNKPAGVGMRVSHGCVRLYPEDIEKLFADVPTGTPVRIVNQPVLAAWDGGELYLEVHQPLTEDERDVGGEAEQLLAHLLEQASVASNRLDQAAVAEIVAEKSGMPLPVLRSERTLDQYLAAVRVVENTVPLPAPESTARAE